MLIKDINFFDRYNEAQKREKNVSKQSAIQVIVIGVIVIGTVVTTSILQIQKASLRQEIDSINQFINSPEVIGQIEEINKKQTVLVNVTQYHDSIALANQKIDTIIQPDKQLIKSITELLPVNTVITNFTYANGNVSLSCKTDSQDKIAQYVHALKSLKNVYGVSYSGFNKSEMEYISSIAIGFMPGGVEDESIQ